MNIRVGLLTFSMLILALAIPATSAQDPGDDSGERDYPLEILDISMIVDPVEDFPGPSMELSPGRAVRAVMQDPTMSGLMMESRPRVMSEQELEDMLRRSDPVWDEGDDGVRLTILKRKLYLQGPPSAVSKVRKLLQALEIEAGKSWCLRALILEAPPEGSKLFENPPQVITAVEVSAKLQAAKAAGWKVLGDASVCALNYQRVNVTDGRERSFVVDVDVEVAQDSAAADPIVEVLRDGLILDARPVSSPTGKTVRLDFFLAYLQFEKNEPLSTGNASIGDLDMPRISGFRLASSVTIPSGSSLLLGPLVPSGRPGGAVGEVLPGKKQGGEGDPKPTRTGKVYVILSATEVR